MPTGLRIMSAVSALAVPGLAAAQTPDIDRIFARWNSTGTPGCVMGVESPKFSGVKAYGMADLEHGVANTPESTFEVGSVSKQFTAAAVLLLAQDGRLKLNDDIRKYLPEFPDYGAKVTVNHLLTHTSGVRDWGYLGYLQGWGRTERTMTQADVLALLARQRALDFTPGDEFAYSNSNYNLLAIIVERVAGQPFEVFTERRIFAPLNMRATRWRTDLPVKGRSIAYAKGAQGYERATPLRESVGDDGLLTTVGDLLLWNRALTERKLGELVAAEFERQGALNSDRPIRYARGLRVQRRHGAREVSHGGATGGYKAWVARYPDAAISIAVLCNAFDVGASGANLGVQIADYFLPGAPAAKPSPTAAGRVEDSTAYQGLFINQSSGLPLTLVSSADGLKTGNGVALVPEGAGFRMGGDRVTFVGKDLLRIEDIEGNLTEYRRRQPARAAASAPYLGRYVSDELAATWFVEERDGGMVLQFDGRPALTFPLRPAYGEVFLFNTPGGVARGAIVRFKRDARGAVEAAEIGWGRVRAVRFERVRER